MLSMKQKTSPLESEAVDFAPVRIVEIELEHPLPPVSTLALDEKTGQRYKRALCLIRLHSQPLGVMELQLDESGLSVEEYAQHIWRMLSAMICGHLREDGLPPVARLDAAGLPCPDTPRCIVEREQLLAHAPFVSVIVSTHDRPEQIQSCLRALLSLHYPRYEVIIVDNAPSTTATADFIQQAYHDVPQIRYMREDRPGLSWARNCGVMAARGEILAFTDDDVIVDPYWLIGLVKGFSLADDVACVSGLLLPLELETPEQIWLDEFYGGCWSDRSNKWFTRNIYDMRENRPKSPIYPYTPGQFGAGANTAFTAAFLRRVGGFDPALGAGSKVGGEDNAAFLQVITQGYKLVYEPIALVYHQHRRDYTSLRKQIYHNATGTAAYPTKIILDNPRLLFDFVSKLPYGLFRFLRARLSKNNGKSAHYPQELAKLELKGMLHGLFVYIWSRGSEREEHKELASRMARAALPADKES
jgi:glycosyltransferase involved in cell wall biosynthesis